MGLPVSGDSSVIVLIYIALIMLPPWAAAWVPALVVGDCPLTPLVVVSPPAGLAGDRDF